MFVNSIIQKESDYVLFSRAKHIISSSSGDVRDIKIPDILMPWECISVSPCMERLCEIIRRIDVHSLSSGKLNTSYRAPVGPSFSVFPLFI